MKRSVLVTMGVAVLCMGGLALGQWSENFDGYNNGQKLCGEGGWECWWNDPGADAKVTDAQANSGKFSVDIIGASDLVYPSLNATEGQWTLSMMHYVVAGNNNSTYLIVNNEYDGDAGTAQWSIEINFTTGGKVVDDFRGEADINTIYDKWVPIRIEVDLDEDTQETYYNDVLLSDGVYAIRGGAVEINNLDLFSNGPQEYFDDIVLAMSGGGEPMGCLYKLKKKVKAKGGCQTCPKKGDMIESGKDCDPDKKLKKECAKKYKPKGKKIPCPDGEKGFCKKIVGVRDSCAG